MRAGLGNRVTARLRGAGRAHGSASDAGFTLVETMVSVAVVGTVMASLGLFFVTAGGVSAQQNGVQSAVQVVNSALETVRATQASALLSGRDRESATAQWNSAPRAVATHLAGTRLVWDDTAAAGTGGNATLPTVSGPDDVTTVNGVDYQRHWYVGQCWQPRAGGTCLTTATPGYVGFYRVVAAVTWSDSRCEPDGKCVRAASTLIANASGDPVFNSNQDAQPPTVTNPGHQTGALTVPVTLTLASSGGAPPITWSATGLPDGLTISSNGIISGTPTRVGVYPVVVSVTDGWELVGTAAFNWTITGPPTLTPPPGNQSHPVGSPVSVPLQATGGTAPFTWTVTKPGPWGATGLPPGLTINPTTGVITGTPTTVGAAKNVTVTVTDKTGQSATATFPWTVTVAPLTLAVPNQSDRIGETVNLDLSASQYVSGGTPPYVRWTAQNLPSGLSIDQATGRITGSGRFESWGTDAVTVTVTDKAGATASTTFTWRIRLLW